MRDPSVEALPWDQQMGSDDPTYRAQIAYLFEKSPFYRQRLQAAGFDTAESVGGLDTITALPFTEKDNLRESRTQDNPIGAHLAVPHEDIARIYSTSGTTGTPSYIPLTHRDLSDWITISCRSYGASGITERQKIITTYGAGPFVAGVTLDAFAALNLTHIPVGAGNSERLMAAVQNLQPDIIAMTPSYALHMAEWAAARDIDIRNSSVKHILVAGEPGGGEPTLRAKLQDAWGAKVNEAMGIGDISVSLWGECTAQDGMHFSGRGLVHVELINPDSGVQIPWTEGAEGELVYTHLRHQSAPLLRFRSRDHVRVTIAPCRCGRTSPRIRCIGRTDDMLIIRGVNLFPSALRDVINQFSDQLSGVIEIRPTRKGVKQEPPLPVMVELAEGAVGEGLADGLRDHIRAKLLVATDITLVPAGTLPRSDYKSKLVNWSDTAD